MPHIGTGECGEDGSGEPGRKHTVTGKYAQCCPAIRRFGDVFPKMPNPKNFDADPYARRPARTGFAHRLKNLGGLP